MEAVLGVGGFQVVQMVKSHSSGDQQQDMQKKNNKQYLTGQSAS